MNQISYHSVRRELRFWYVAFVLVAASSFSSDQGIAQPSGSPNRHESEFPQGIIVGNGYPRKVGSSTSVSVLDQLPDSAALVKVIDRIRGRSKIIGDLMRQTSVFLNQEDNGSDLDIPTEIRLKSSQVMPNRCFAYAKRSKLGGDPRPFDSWNYNAIQGNRFHADFGKNFFALPLLDGAERPSRIKVLLQLLLFALLGNGQSGVGQDLSDALFLLGTGKDISPGQEKLLKQVEQNVEVVGDGDYGVWKHRIPAHGETLICAKPIKFQRYQPTAGTRQALRQAMSVYESLSPVALQRIINSVEHIINGSLPIYTVIPENRTHHAKLLRSHAGAEILLFPSFSRLPVIDDRPLRPSQLKVFLHETIHLAVDDLTILEEDESESDQEKDVIKTAELLYRMARGLRYDFLTHINLVRMEGREEGEVDMPRLWRQPSISVYDYESYVYDYEVGSQEFLSLICRGGLGERTQVLAEVGPHRVEQSWATRIEKFTYAKSFCWYRYLNTDRVTEEEPR